MEFENVSIEGPILLTMYLQKSKHAYCLHSSRLWLDEPSPPPAIVYLFKRFLCVCLYRFELARAHVLPRGSIFSPLAVQLRFDHEVVGIRFLALEQEWLRSAHQCVRLCSRQEIFWSIGLSRLYTS